MLKDGFSQMSIGRDFYIGGARKGHASSGMRDGPDASIVLEVHVRLATGAQASRDISTNVTGGGGEDVSIICVKSISDRCPKISES